jgi:uncharacterized protein YkwD
VATAALGDCTPDPSWPANRADLAAQVLALVNQHRQDLGLNALHVSPALTAAAVWKARHMAAYRYLQHADPAPPIDRSAGERAAACGYGFSFGENIAYGYPTAAAVMQGWENSPGHRANMLSPNFNAIGVGVARSASGVLYWVQDFGSKVDSGSKAAPKRERVRANVPGLRRAIVPRGRAHGRVSKLPPPKRKKK